MQHLSLGEILLAYYKSLIASSMSYKHDDLFSVRHLALLNSAFTLKGSINNASLHTDRQF